MPRPAELGTDSKDPNAIDVVVGIIADARDRVLSANVYFGAMPVVEALKDDPDIVLSGRVTDTGITLAALIHEFGWAADDYDKLAQGIVASHLIECGGSWLSATASGRRPRAGR